MHRWILGVHGSRARWQSKIHQLTNAAHCSRLVVPRPARKVPTEMRHRPWLPLLKCESRGWFLLPWDPNSRSSGTAGSLEILFQSKRSNVGGVFLAPSISMHMRLLVLASAILQRNRGSAAAGRAHALAEMGAVLCRGHRQPQAHLHSRARVVCVPVRPNEQQSMRN